MGFKVDLDDEDSEDKNDGDVLEEGNADIPPESDKAAQPVSSLPKEVLQIKVGKKIDTTCPPAPAALRRTLACDVAKSKDKLFLIKRPRPGHKLASWHLVQVDEEETNWKRAKAEGIYHVRYFVRCYADSKKMKIRDCTYWPEIHEFK